MKPKLNSVIVFLLKSNNLLDLSPQESNALWVFINSRSSVASFSMLGIWKGHIAQLSLLLPENCLKEDCSQCWMKSILFSIMNLLLIDNIPFYDIQFYLCIDFDAYINLNDETFSRAPFVPEHCYYTFPDVIIIILLSSVNSCFQIHVLVY